MSDFSKHTSFDCHMHTPLCGHAIGNPREYVDTAGRNGISLITFTCHIPMKGEGYSQQGIRMSHSDIPAYREMIADARGYGADKGIEVLYGIEAEITPEEAELEQMQDLIRAEEFDFVLGSLHHMMPIWGRLMARNGARSDEEKVRYYFNNIAEGARRGIYHSIAHPDVIRMYGTLQAPFNPADHESVIKDCLDVVAGTGTCLEINTSGLIKGDYVVHPDPKIMTWALERGISFTIGSDSHTPDRVGADFEQVIAEYKHLGLSELIYFRDGQRNAVSL